MNTIVYIHALYCYLFVSSFFAYKAAAFHKTVTSCIVYIRDMAIKVFFTNHFMIRLKLLQYLHNLKKETIEARGVVRTYNVTD